MSRMKISDVYCHQLCELRGSMIGQNLKQGALTSTTHNRLVLSRENREAGRPLDKCLKPWRRQWVWLRLYTYRNMIFWNEKVKKMKWKNEFDQDLLNTICTSSSSCTSSQFWFLHLDYWISSTHWPSRGVRRTHEHLVALFFRKGFKRRIRLLSCSLSKRHPLVHFSMS